METKKRGRPPKYSDASVMEAKIEEYFNSLASEDNKPDEPPTMAGLTLALGFTDRQSLYDYIAKPEYTCILKKAKVRVEKYWERKLAGTSPTGAIFWLKNHAGYADKQEISGPEGKPIDIHVHYD